MFDRFARPYDSFMRLFHLDDCGALLKRIESEECSVVHDIGGGTGTLADALERCGKAVYLIDPSEAMTRVALAKNSNISVVNSEYVPGLDIPKADVIVLRDVLHHIKSQAAVLDCCYGYLSDNGRILIQDFNPKSLSARMLLVFERCCFERVYPIWPERLKELSTERGMAAELMELSPRDYMCIGRKAAT